MCIRHTAASLARTAAMAPGARSALMSLIMLAPSSSAARITSGLIVSTDTGTGVPRKPFSTGSSRRSSSSTLTTAAAPGRLDSAPRSTRSAPSSISRCACAMAAAGSRNLPPSEKESGVMLTTPMINGRSSDRRKRPH